MVLTVQFMSISAVTRSIDGGAFDACPILDRAPRIHCMADRRREKVRRQRSQACRVVEYDCSHHAGGGRGRYHADHTHYTFSCS